MTSTGHRLLNESEGAVFPISVVPVAFLSLARIFEQSSSFLSVSPHFYSLALFKVLENCFLEMLRLNFYFSIIYVRVWVFLLFLIFMCK